MEPTAAMAHTRLADSSIPEPAEEAAVTDASARKIQREQQRGRAPGEERRGEERRENQNLTSFPGLRLAFITAGTKTARPSSALPTLLLNPHQHTPHHIHTHGRERHTQTNTHVQAFSSMGKQKRLEQEKLGEGD